MQLITNKISTGSPKKSLRDIVDEHLQKKAAASATIKTAGAAVAIKTAEENKDEAPSSGQLDVEPLHQTGESVKPSSTEKKDDATKSTITANEKGEKDEGASSGQPEWEGKSTNNNMQDPKAEEDGKKAKTAGCGPCTEGVEETKPCCDKEEDKEKKAGSQTKFVKVANLTDKSKEAFRAVAKKYYPASYVDLLLADK